jgi:hypothetical protein
MMPSRAEQYHLSSFTKPRKDIAQLEARLTRATNVLSELYELLEEYGPCWYTQAKEERAASTLRLLRNG